MTVQIIAPHFCAGVVLRATDGHFRVTQAAPILKYTQGWTYPFLRAYVLRHGWEWHFMPGEVAVIERLLDNPTVH